MEIIRSRWQRILSFNCGPSKRNSSIRKTNYILLRWSLFLWKGRQYPAGTWRLYNVASRRINAMTLHRRCLNAAYLLVRPLKPWKYLSRKEDNEMFYQHSHAVNLWWNTSVLCCTQFTVIHILSETSHCLSRQYLAGTCCLYSVASTSIQRHVALTLMRRCVNFICHTDFDVTLYKLHMPRLSMTFIRRRINDVASTWIRPYFNVACPIVHSFDMCIHTP